MQLKIKKITIIIIAILIITLLITMLIPIKFCVSIFSSNSDDEFYIVRYSRDENVWLLVGDKNGLFDENLSQERLAQPEGNEFKFEKAVSVDLYMQGDATNFIVYGTETKNGEGEETYYAYTKEFICFTIKDTGWDVLGEIETTNSFRSIFSKKYLNIYDYKWFDNLRDQMYGFLDGETNF